MNRWALIGITALLASTLSLPAFAQWKWRDKGGRTQYSDLPPPPGTPEAEILQRPSGGSALRRAGVVVSPPASAASAAVALPVPRASDPELEARRKKAEQEIVDKLKADEAKLAVARADNCNRAKEQLRTFDSGQRIARINANGEREIIDDATRASESRRAREVISSDCK